MMTNADGENAEFLGCEIDSLPHLLRNPNFALNRNNNQSASLNFPLTDASRFWRKTFGKLDVKEEIAARFT